VKIPNLEGSVPTRGDDTPARGGPTQVEAHATDILPRIKGSCVNEAMPQPGNASNGMAPPPRPPRCPGFYPPEDAALGIVVSTPRSSDIVDFGANELGCWATQEHRPYLLAGCRRRESQSWHAHRLRP
jgi:hypothetical protein